MNKRWVAVFFLAMLSLSAVEAHKNPIIEYSYVGHLWEAAYTTAPRQPVIDEPVVLHVSVVHPGSKGGPDTPITGNVTTVINIYEDDTHYVWYAGEQYKRPNWVRLQHSYGEPTGLVNDFSTTFITDRPGSYLVTIDYYEDGLYIGQSMHNLDVEQRTVGPLFLGFSGIVLVGVLFGVRKGVL